MSSMSDINVNITTLEMWSFERLYYNGTVHLTDLPPVKQGIEILVH